MITVYLPSPLGPGVESPYEYQEHPHNCEAREQVRQRVVSMLPFAGNAVRGRIFRFCYGDGVHHGKDTASQLYTRVSNISLTTENKNLFFTSHAQRCSIFAKESHNMPLAIRVSTREVNVEQCINSVGSDAPHSKFPQRTSQNGIHSGYCTCHGYEDTMELTTNESTKWLFLTDRYF